MHSVASFFVSRVDTEVDKRLEEPAAPRTCAARPALANARAAYQRFKEIFHGERFAALRAAGAPVQRPLWASTGVKNPAYPDTMYVDEPRRPAHRQHDADGDAARRRRARERRAGATAAIDPTAGPAARCADGGHRHRRRHRQAAARRHRRVRRRRWRSCSPASTPSARRSSRAARRRSSASIPDDLEHAIAPRIDAGRRRRRRARGSGRRTPRCGARPATPEVADRLGWLDDRRADARGASTTCRPSRTRSATAGSPTSCCSGMGGSSLAPEVLRALVRPQRRLADAARARLDRPGRDAARSRRRSTSTRRCSSSPRSPAGRSRRCRCSSTSGRRRPDGAHFVAVTDPGTSLEKLAARARLPPRVRQRPRHRRPLQRAVLLRARARGARRASTSRALLAGRPGRRAGVRAVRPRHAQRRAVAGLRAGRAGARRAATSSRSSSTPPLASLRPVGRAARRRVDRQAGPRASCRSPTSRSASRSDYGDDRVFVHLRDADAPDEAQDAGVAALARRRAPGDHAPRARGAGDLGRIFFFAEFATAVAGWVLGINPFDQPNVQEAKDNTQARPAPIGRGPARSRRRVRRRAARAARRRRAAAYVAILGYLRRRASSTRAVADLRARDPRPRPRRRRRSATARASCTRPASSTRAARRRAASCSSSTTPAEDVEIPGEPYTFAPLKRAQAIGDLQTLRDHGLPAARSRWTATTRPGAARPDRAHRGGSLMQLGFVGLGKMGGNMVAPHPPRLRPRGRRLRPRRRRRRARPRARRDRRVARSRTSWRSSRRRARSGSWCRPASPTAADGRRARRAARAAATRSSTAATRSGPTTSARAEELREQGHPLRRRRHVAAACGASRSATA